MEPAINWIVLWILTGTVICIISLTDLSLCRANYFLWAESEIDNCWYDIETKLWYALVSMFIKRIANAVWKYLEILGGIHNFCFSFHLFLFCTHDEIVSYNKYDQLNILFSLENWWSLKSTLKAFHRVRASLPILMMINFGLLPCMSVVIPFYTDFVFLPLLIIFFNFDWCNQQK